MPLCFSISREDHARRRHPGSRLVPHGGHFVERHLESPGFAGLQGQGVAADGDGGPLLDRLAFDIGKRQADFKIADRLRAVVRHRAVDGGDGVLQKVLCGFSPAGGERR